MCERGAEVSYGFHHFARKSSENRMTGFSPSSRGISLGYAMGNSLVKGRIRGLGFYESTNTANAQFLMYEAETLLNFYLLEFIRTRQNVLDIYLSAGLNFNHLEKGFKSTGTHRTQNTFSQQVGAGIECLLRRERKITYLFAEVNIGTPFRVDEEKVDALDVLPGILTSFNIGVRYAFQKPGNHKLGG